MQGLANTEQIETKETAAVSAAAAADTDIPTTSQSAVDSSRPFPCGFCNAAFRQSNHRSYHERVIHGVDRRTRQPKAGPMIRIPTNASGGSHNISKGSNGGARKSISRPAVGNGFTSAVDAEEDEEMEDADDVEAEDIEPDPDVEDEDLAEELDGDAEADADGWIDEEIDQEVEDEEQVEDEEGEEEDEEEEEVGSEAAPGSPHSALSLIHI